MCGNCFVFKKSILTGYLPHDLRVRWLTEPKSAFWSESLRREQLVSQVKFPNWIQRGKIREGNFSWSCIWVQPFNLLKQFPIRFIHPCICLIIRNPYVYYLEICHGVTIYKIDCFTYWIVGNFIFHILAS